MLYVTLAQSVWLFALSNAAPKTISVGTTTLFVLMLVWAMLLLDSFPTGAQWLGCAFITTSIASSIVRTVKEGGGSDGDGSDEDAEAALHKVVGDEAPRMSHDAEVRGA